MQKFLKNIYAAPTVTQYRVRRRTRTGNDRASTASACSVSATGNAPDTRRLATALSQARWPVR